MTIEEEFAKLYTTHVYKDGMTNPDSLSNPRGLARAVVYGGDGPGTTKYPYVTGVSAGGSLLTYGLGGGPSDSALDEKVPSYIQQNVVARDPELEADLISASLIEKRQTIVNSNMRKFGPRASSVLRVEGAIP